MAKKKRASPPTSPANPATKKSAKKSSRKYVAKTVPTGGDVAGFLAKIADPQQRADALALVEMMRETTGVEPKMWGTMIGFGEHHYRYASGHEGDVFAVGFAPRSGALALYVLAQTEDNSELLAKLGKHKAGKGCLYLKRLADADPAVLRQLVRRAYDSRGE